jgi:hypothetical protein
MKNQSDEKEMLSRRGFARSAAAALAAIPLAASLVNAQKRKQRARTPGAQVPDQKPQEAMTRVADRDRNAHDTPPPLEIINGSFIVDMENDFDPSDIVIMGAIRRHNIKPSAGKIRIFPAHIKIVDGSGEMLYRLDTNSNANPHPAEAFKITALLRDGTTVVAATSTIVGNMQTFVIDTNNDRSLAARVPGDAPVGSKRRARRRLKRNDGVESDTSIQRLTITGRSTNEVLYSLLPATDLNSGGNELRIMIWLEEK